MNILMATSNYPPFLTNGGSVYFKTLTNSLKKAKNIKILIALTEYAEGMKLLTKDNGLLVYRILFPKASKKRTERWGIVMKMFGFLYNQAILTMSLPLLAIIYRPKVIHIHASFFKLTKKINNYNYLIHYTLLFIKKLKLAQILIDVRGTGVCFANYNSFDKVLCCSENVFNLCLKLGINEKKCILIPIPFSLSDIQSATYIDMSDFTPYICFASVITESKGIYELIDGFLKLNGYKDINLVIIGVNLEGEKFISKIINSHRIYYLGPKYQDEVIPIISQAELFILPSKSEGLPRSCLEAVAVGTKVLFPPGIPEFNHCCSKFVIPFIKPDVIKHMIIKALESRGNVEYQFEKHDPAYTVNLILDIYNNI